jgi:hypothetical protein
MDLHQAQSIWGQVKQARHHELKGAFIKAAVRYARIRTDWRLSSCEERAGMDIGRSRAHDALIAAGNALSRNMAKSGEGIAWRDELGMNRIQIGDFACLLHCILGIEAQ